MNQLEKSVINIGYTASVELANKLWSLLVQAHIVRELFRLAVRRTQSNEIKALANKMCQLLPETYPYYEDGSLTPWERERAVLDEGTLSLLIQLRHNTELMANFEKMFESKRNCIVSETCEGVYLAEAIDTLQRYFVEWKELRHKYVENYYSPIEFEFGLSALEEE